MGLCLLTNAQSKKLTLPQDQISFYSGNWSGKGEFASGKKIEAKMSFRLSLDSTWLVQTHTDVAPATYKAESYWGTDAPTKLPVTYIFDSFNGHRRFETVVNGNSIILTRSAEDKQRGKYYEHFIYQKLSENSFKMTYEVSKDNINWRMVDYLVFARESV